MEPGEVRPRSLAEEAGIALKNAHGYGRPPAGYGYPSSIRIAPGLVGQYHYHRPFYLNLHCLVIPPRGQLHTAEPSVRSTGDAWGGGVTSLLLR